MQELVILVDEHDRERGVEEKLAAHRSGTLHRAFSVFVIDNTGRLLLQRRADAKYHSAGLWSNTCCGHPRPGEPVAAAARRRLREEMGFECTLEHVGAFTYRAALDNGLIEHEYDHVFAGRFHGAPRPDPSEVSQWRWADLDTVLAEHAASPERFTAWFSPALEAVRRQQPRPHRRS